MVGTELNMQGRIKASTIIEVIISMIIIIVVFGIAMMIFGNVSHMSLSTKKIKAEAILKDRLLNILPGVDSLNKTITDGDFRIEQQIKPYNGNEDLLQVSLTAYDSNNEKLAEMQKVIINL
jgi:hypothetical protein